MTQDCIYLSMQSTTLGAPRTWNWKKNIFRSIEEDDGIQTLLKAKAFHHNIKIVKSKFRNMLRARLTLNVHSLRTLKAIENHKGYKSLDTLVPSESEIDSNRYLLNAVQSEIKRPPSALELNTPELWFKFYINLETR